MSKPASAPKNNLKQQSYELINAYFDIEDKIKNYKQVKTEIENKHNISLVPVPECLKGIPENMVKSFDLIANYSAEVKLEDIEKLKQSLDKIDDELEGWMEKVSLVEIKLQKMKKNGMEYHLIDPKLRKLIKTVEKLKKDEYDFENEEDDELGVGHFGPMVISDKNIVVPKEEEAKPEALATTATTSETPSKSAPGPSELNDDQLNTWLVSKIGEEAKHVHGCLEKLTKLQQWSKAKDIEKELYFLLNAGSDADYIRTLQIDEEKFTNLESDVHVLEKKANNLETYYEKFEDRYLKDPKRKTVIKKTELEQKLADFGRKMSCVRNLQRCPSDSCLSYRTALKVLLNNTQKKSQAIHLLNFLNDLVFHFHEPAAQAIRKRMEIIDIRRKFQGIIKRRSSLGNLREITCEQLLEKLEETKDETFKKLMTEHVQIIKERKEAENKANDGPKVIETTFDKVWVKIMDAAKADLQKAQKFLEEDTEAALAV